MDDFSRRWPDDANALLESGFDNKVDFNFSKRVCFLLVPALPAAAAGKVIVAAGAGAAVNAAGAGAAGAGAGTGAWTVSPPGFPCWGGSTSDGVDETVNQKRDSDG